MSKSLPKIQSDEDKMKSRIDRAKLAIDENIEILDEVAIDLSYLSDYILDDGLSNVSKDIHIIIDKLKGIVNDM